jgi:DNA-binding NarL/FixJ family response regulator
MKRGLRFFDEGSGPDGEVYRAQTVDELSHVIPGLLKGPPAPAVTQPARGDKSPEDVAAEPPAQTPKPWKPTKATWHVIRLMQQGKSNDEIAAMENVKVEKSAANLRKIRERARRNDYLTRLKSRET